MTVKDTTAPEAITLADVTGECSATVTAPTTTDNCAGTIIATTDDALTYTEQGEYVITWTFNDGNGNITTVEQNVFVKDTTAPDAITLADVTGECSATVTAPTTTDNCAGPITATTDAPLLYTEQGEYMVTWTFNDGNGNITTVEQNVIVKDTTAPDAITLADVTGECEATVVAPTTTDNCAGTITATTNNALTYTEKGEYMVTWTFNDGNGNITTVDQKVTITGIEKPALGQIIQPSCANPTGSFSITAVAGMTYSLNGGEFGSATTFEGLAAGTYTVTAKSAQGCISEAVSVTINETPDAPAAPVVEELMQATCEDPSGFLVLTIVEGVSFTLTDANGNTFTDEDADGIFEDLTPGSYSVTAQNADGCVSNAITVTIEEPQGNVSITNPTSPICDDAEEMFDLNSLLSADTAAGTWVDTDQTGALSGSMLNPDMAAGFYTFTYVVEGACPSSTEVTIEIEDCGEELPCQISDIRNSISKVVTPNNDQINDKFEVGIGIDCGFTYTLKVFNRWGNEVFSSNNYSDEWDGNSSNSVTGDQLPSGTYFYIVEIKQSGFEPIQGYIYLGTK
ncbi:MAG: gliding motility-associated C-terminal domain-containing protein [Salinimicrobium sediminis]|nr:gliding motility-associated C-terminal domain-containing protein [Salinimicrobium sediminis]